MFDMPNRREFLIVSAAGFVTAGFPLTSLAADAPTDDPARALQLDWTAKLPWSRVVDITTVGSGAWEERLERAQAQLAEQGGGVVFFPAGEYRFTRTVRLRNGIILRGATPTGATRAVDENYSPPTRFEFPKFEPKLDGDGASTDGAFQGIHLADPSQGAGCGVVHIAINRGHIHFGESEDRTCGGNRIVYGCVLRNAVLADPKVPDRNLGQLAWQRYTLWHHGAINVKSRENLLVANNRLPKSTDNFTMNGYVLKDRRQGIIAVDGVVFDYDNRPGIYANESCIGGPGGEGGGTPETFPWGFRKGLVIRDNFIYSTGKTAIAFTGDGVVCSHNVIRFEKDIWRPTNTGLSTAYGSSTNDNRAVQMRGYRWVVEHNDYEVYSNFCFDHVYKINDGEGLMHEAHCNSTVVDSRLCFNKGNTYLSIFNTGDIDGLLVEGNDIRVHKDAAIYVNANRHGKPHSPCRRVRIINNTTGGGGIVIAGDPGQENVVRDNRHVAKGKKNEIENRANAEVANNTGYEP